VRDTQLKTLQAIGDGATTAKALCYALCVPRSSMTSRLRILEREGYIARDGAHVRLLPLGRDVVEVRKGDHYYSTTTRVSDGHVLTDRTDLEKSLCRLVAIAKARDAETDELLKQEASPIDRGDAP
jgi:predicted methyltransferase